MRPTTPLNREPINEHPDGIYILYPVITGFSHLPETRLQCCPGADEGESSSWDYYIKGDPVPAKYVPLSMTFDTPGASMPDFYYWLQNEIIVSSRAKAVLDELGFGEIEYIEIAMTVNQCMSPADAYYYINVLPRRSVIDWPETIRRNPKQHKRMDGTVFFEATAGDLNVVFQPRTDEEPAFWRESNLDVEHVTDPCWVVMRADTWHELDRRFPNQLNPWRWYLPDFG